MSNEIDDYIVEMKFNNGQFENGIKESVASLEDLKKGLNLEAAAKNIQDLDVAGKKFSLAGMADGVDHIASKFGALGAIGFSALQKITGGVIDFGKKMLGAALDPLFEGGKKRALNIEQAKFQFRGLGVDIKAAMEDALYGVKDTAYGLDAAAAAASQLSASGIQLGDDMKASLRGISGVAAMTNSSYEDTARIFTTVAGNGRLMGDQLNQISGRGLNVAATLAKSMGVSEQAVRDMVSKGLISFDIFSNAMNDAYGENATKANETYTGSLSNMRAALSRIGAAFAAPNFEKMRDIFNALTPVINQIGKVIEPVVAGFIELQDVVGGNIIDRLNNLDLMPFKPAVVVLMNSVKNILSSLSAVIKPIVYAFKEIFPPKTADQILDMVHGFARLTYNLKPSYDAILKIRRVFKGFFAFIDIGRMILVKVAEMFVTLFKALTSGSGAIGDAAANFGDFIVKIRDLMKNGKGLDTFFSNLTNGLLFIINVSRKVIGFFAGLVAGIWDFSSVTFTSVIESVKGLFTATKKWFDSIKGGSDDASDSVGGLGGFVTSVGDKVKMFVERLKELISGIGPAISDWAKNLDFGDSIGLVNSTLMVGLIAGAITIAKNVFLQIRNLVWKFRDLRSVAGGGNIIIRNITKVYNGLLGTMRNMQTTLKATTLLMIAAAIALLAVSLMLLSKIDPERLNSSLAAITMLVTELVTAMWLLNKTVNPASMGKIVGLGVALALLAIAVLILAAAVKKMSDMGWEELAKGLVGVTVILGILVGVSKLLSTFQPGPGLIAQAASLVVLAVAIKIMASVVKTLGAIDGGGLAKGLAGLAAIMAAIVGFLFTMSKFEPTKMFGTAIALVVLGAALKIMASVVKDFAAMDPGMLAQGLGAITGILTAIILFDKLTGGGGSLLLGAAAVLVVAASMKILAKVFEAWAAMGWEEIGKVGTMLAGTLAIIAGALWIMQEPLLLVGAAALIIVAKALEILGPVLAGFTDFSWEEIGKIGTVLAGALLIIAVGVNAMTGAIVGAAALLIVSSALAVLAPVLVMLGNMSWTQIGTGLAVLAAVLLILGIAGMALIPALPGLFGLAAVLVLIGVAVALVGVGLMAVGLGVALFATGLTALAGISVLAGKAIAAMVGQIIDLIPLAAQKFGEGLIAFAEAISKGGVQFTEALVTLLQSLIDAVTLMAPQIIDMVVMLLELLMTTLDEHMPDLVDKGTKLLIKLIEGFTDNIPDIVDAVADFITAFFEALEGKADEVITAGTDLIIALIEGLGSNGQRVTVALAQAILEFLEALSNTIDYYAPRIRDAGRDVAFSIADGLTGGLLSRTAAVAIGAWNLAKSALSSAKAALNSNSPSKEFIKVGKSIPDGMVIGIVKYGDNVDTATAAVGESAMKTMSKTLSNLGDTLSGNMDANPTIRPVLDLSDIKKNAGLIGGMLMPSALTVGSSYRNANSIADSYSSASDTSSELIPAMAAQSPNISITQHNTSPKALSSAEIYRQTNNALSVAKGALKG